MARPKGRSRKPPSDVPTPGRKRIDGLTTMTIQLGEEDRELLAGIVRNLAAFTRSLPSQTAAIRWSIRETATRLKAKRPLIISPSSRPGELVRAKAITFQLESADRLLLDGIKEKADGIFQCKTAVVLALRWSIREMAATMSSGGWPKTPPPE